MAEERPPRQRAVIDSFERHQAVMEDLAARATGPLGWLAVQRQAASYLRQLQPRLTWPRSAPVRAEMDQHRDRLAGYQAQAQAALADLDPLVVAEAASRLGLRLALIGKGGAGKTVISATLARLLARRGRNVFAADLDTNPGLAISLGLFSGFGAGRGTAGLGAAGLGLAGLGLAGQGAAGQGAVDAGLAPELVEQDEGSAYGWRLAAGVSPREAVERFATVAPDGVRLLSLGKIGSADKLASKQSVVALVDILLGFGEPEWDAIADLEAGPTTPFERYHAFADDVIVVVGPAWRSAMTARRLLPMVGDDRRPVVVANRFHGEPDHPGLAPQVRIPFDPELAEAERQGLSPLDACPDSPAIAAIERLMEHFLAIPQEVSTS